MILWHNWKLFYECYMSDCVIVQVCQYLVYRNENHNCGEVNKTEWRISEEGS